MKLDAATTPVPPGRFVHEEWPYEPRFKRVNGWRMHYIDEGAGDPLFSCTAIPPGDSCIGNS
jgi:hypothetical protein